MSEKNDPTRPASDAEFLRRLAFDELFVLPSADERADTPDKSRPASTIDIVEEMDRLKPFERERVMRVAARRLAFQILFEMDARNITDPAFITTTLAQIETLGPGAAALTTRLISGAISSKAAADEEFRKLAPEWPTHRLAGVDRAILRLCYYELTARINPAAIVLNEGVELAKHFSTDRSPAFINALLDKVAKAMAAAPAPGEPSSPAAGDEPSTPQEQN
jgi:N utilization substance protein B